MHQEFYDKQGANIKVYPALQYLRNDDGTNEKLHRVSTMVVWDSVSAWSEWRESIDALSEEDRAQADKEYNAFVAKYNKNTEVVAQRRWCML